MSTTAEREFVNYSTEKLTQFCGRIEDCLGRLTHEQVWMRNADTQNAVGNLVLHLCGNVTQWIGSGVAGRPDTRERDKEFAARGEQDPAELAERIRHVVEDAVSVIRSLSPQRLLEPIQVQKYDTTVLGAVYHVVCHFCEHTGQILFATKLLTSQDLGYYRHLSAPTHSEKTP